MSDSFAGRTVLTGTSGVQTENNTGYTMETGEPTVSGKMGKSAWFAYTPAADGVLYAHTNATASTAQDTVLAVYTGSAVNALTLQAASDDDGDALTPFSQLFVPVTAGTQYQIQLGTFGGGSPGPLTLTWAFRALPAKITDSFNRADGIGLGKTDGTFVAQWQMFDAAGVGISHQMGIGSNQAKNYRNIVDDPATGLPYPTSAGHALIDTWTGDGTVSMRVAANASTGAPGKLLFRWSNSANYWQISINYFAASVSLSRTTGGVTTVVATSATGLPVTAGTIYAAEFLGNQIRVLCNGVEVIAPQTSTFNQTVTQHGMILGNVDWIDDWAFAWPGGEPMLRVVSSDASSIWRVTPTLPNPDGGLLRLVEADGTKWVQDNAGTKPLTLIDADGTPWITLPMSLDP